MQKDTKNWSKLTLAFILCLLVRLIPFRVPNIEPIMATQMPFAKAYGAPVAFFFGFTSIVLYDILTSGIGVWTVITAVAYGLLGLWAGVYFKNKKSARGAYVRFAIMGTLFFDIVTGFSVGPLFFHQPLMSAIAGQIPFTALHLFGNITFAFILSPAIYNFAIQERPARNAYSIAVAGGKRKRLPLIIPLQPKII